MVGPYVNAACVLGGSVLGAVLAGAFPVTLRARMTHVFGLSAMGIGVAMIVKVKCLPAVVLALLVGTIVGEVFHLETAIGRLAGKTRYLVEKLFKPKHSMDHDEFMQKFVALMVLFCVSGTGVFGSMNEGMTGDPTLLIVKAILDFFTSAIFAASLGISVATLCVPQVVVQAALYFAAASIMPLTTPDMIGDFSASGGLVLLATGFRICEMKNFAIANMIPSMFLVMPLSALWVRLLG